MPLFVPAALPDGAVEWVYDPDPRRLGHDAVEVRVDAEGVRLLCFANPLPKAVADELALILPAAFAVAEVLRARAAAAPTVPPSPTPARHTRRPVPARN